MTFGKFCKYYFMLVALVSAISGLIGFIYLLAVNFKNAIDLRKSEDTFESIEKTDDESNEE